MQSINGTLSLNKTFFLAKVPKKVLFSLGMILISSLFCIYSSCSAKDTNIFFIRQIIYLIASVPLFLFLASIKQKTLYNWAYRLLFLSFILLIIVIPFGKKVLGATRWLDFGFITIQPSEIAKFAVVLSVAKFYSKINAINILKFSTTIRLLLLVFPVVALVIIQPDFASAMIFVATICIMMFSAGVPRWQFVVATLVAFISAPIIWVKYLKDYQKLRIMNFLFPEHDPFGSGYNIIQSKIAIGSGGFLGKGYLQSTQVRLNFLPEHYADFIFTTIGEEFGFIGAIMIILAYMLIIFYGFNVIERTNSAFNKLLVIGCISILFFHMFINIGMTIALMPVAGIPLLMISYGGTALFLGIACVAIIVNVGTNK